MGSTTVSVSRNWSHSSRMSQSSWVQVLVNARGKNASSTFFPRKSDSVTGPLVAFRVKSGASVPTAGTDIVIDRGQKRGAVHHDDRVRACAESHAASC